jgi:hypothetical protein
VNLNIGRPPKQYDLDIDTGSDLTWVQCDAPCTGCTKVKFFFFLLITRINSVIGLIIS